MHTQNDCDNAVSTIRGLSKTGESITMPIVLVVLLVVAMSLVFVSARRTRKD